METTYKRPIYKTIFERLKEPRRFIQVLAGPRQVGKTVLARQVIKNIGISLAEEKVPRGFGPPIGLRRSST